MTRIEPVLPAGFRDTPPEEMIPLNEMMRKIAKVCERFGALPLQTSVGQRYEVLTGGEPNNKQIFELASRREGAEDDRSDIAFRFDLTVALARFVAATPGLPKPFKRYETGRVFRGENPQAKRFREFTQFDLDIVGSGDPMSDAEIIAWMNAVMQELGVPAYVIKVNTRKILNGLAVYAGFDESKSKAVLTVLDKIDKIGWDGVATELEKIGLSDKAIAYLDAFVSIRTSSVEETLDAVEKLMANAPTALEGVRNLREITACLDAMGVPRNVWTVDLSIARGLGYYTGAVFETNVIGMEKFGSVLSGGRYDDLLERFGAGQVPAVGASVGVSRLFEVLKDLGLVKFERSVAQAMVLNFEPSARVAVQKAAASLRESGVNTELYFGKEDSFRGQLANAVSRELKVVVIIGKKELESGLVTVKNMGERTQTQVPIEKVGDEVLGILGK